MEALQSRKLRDLATEFAKNLASDRFFNGLMNNLWGQVRTPIDLSHWGVHMTALTRHPDKTQFVAVDVGLADCRAAPYPKRSTAMSYRTPRAKLDLAKSPALSRPFFLRNICQRACSRVLRRDKARVSRIGKGRCARAHLPGARLLSCLRHVQIRQFQVMRLFLGLRATGREWR